MRPRRLKNEINVVPYIDVMLVLLVIFMVAAPMMQTGSINLPTAGEARDRPPDNHLRVEVDAKGGLRVGSANNTRPVNKMELEAYLKAEKAKNPEVAVLVASDEGAKYGEVLTVLDNIKALEFNKVGLAARRQ